MIRTNKNDPGFSNMLEELRISTQSPNSRFGKCLVLSKHEIQHRVSAIQVAERGKSTLSKSNQNNITDNPNSNRDKEVQEMSSGIIRVFLYLTPRTYFVYNCNLFLIKYTFPSLPMLITCV
jgi:hypothetical protein